MTQSSTNYVSGSLAGEVLVELDKRSSTAMHAQIESLLRSAIRSGKLAAGTALPSSRQLASELGMSRGVVVEAYQQLTAEGYLVSQTGSFTRVSDGVAVSPTTNVARASEASAIVDFRYGRPDVTHFPPRCMASLTEASAPPVAARQVHVHRRPRSGRVAHRPG